MIINRRSDAQIALIRSAFQRLDQCVVVPTGRGASAKKSASRLIEDGWLKEIKAKSGAPDWRTDQAAGTAYSLKLTAAGLKAIAAIDVQESGADATPSAPRGDGATKSLAPRSNQWKRPLLNRNSARERSSR